MPKVIRHRDHLPNTKFVYHPHLHRAGFYGLYFSGHLFLGKNHYIHRQNYDLVAVAYCKKGQHGIKSGNYEVILKENDFVVALMNEEFVFQSVGEEASEIYVGYFEGFDLVKRFQLYMNNKIEKLSNNLVPSFIKIIEENLNHQKHNIYKETIDSYTILTNILQEIEKETKKLQRTIIYLNNSYYDKNLSLEKMAKYFGYSPYHFLRIFKKEYEISPIEYLKNIRLEKAKEMLLDRNLTIAEISDFVGFNDQRSLVKLFKEKYHITPKKYQLYALEENQD